MREQTEALSEQQKLALLSFHGEQVIKASAWNAYNKNDNNGSIEKFRQLADQAVARGDITEAMNHWFWLSTALHGAGRLVQALHYLGLCLLEKNFVGHLVLKDRVLSRYLLVAVDLPLSLTKMENCFKEADELIKSWGWEESESRLPVARSRLALFRGQYTEAFDWAQLAMERNWGDMAGYATHTYLVLYMKTSIANQRIDLLEKLLLGKHNFKVGNFQQNRAMVINLVNAEICLAAGELEKALELSRLAENVAWQTHDHTYSYLVFCGRLKILLEAGQIEQAKPVLTHILRQRHCEVGHDAFEARMLLGQYHLTCARMMKDGHMFSSAGFEKHTTSAKIVYGAAKKMGSVIDARLECEHKTSQVNHQLTIVEKL